MGGNFHRGAVRTRDGVSEMSHEQGRSKAMGLNGLPKKPYRSEDGVEGQGQLLRGNIFQSGTEDKETQG